MTMVTGMTEESSQTMRSAQEFPCSDGWSSAITCDRRRMQREQVSDVATQNPTHRIVVSM